MGLVVQKMTLSCQITITEAVGQLQQDSCPEEQMV